ncbi:hypothetical protein AUQ44_01470 [Vibrio cidicii]|uniref:Uncharacterized protein n=1 Tax=Vibrio cidicii TaxID=1763883 RepID=A0A151JFW1_9VIBR|nr:hypothetical protein AUQ44_01470 [Vibrio cidicii]
MWSFFSSFGHSFRFLGKSALFGNGSFEQLPQLSFGIARGQQVWRKVALEVCVCFEFAENDL